MLTHGPVALVRVDLSFQATLVVAMVAMVIVAQQCKQEQQQSRHGARAAEAAACMWGMYCMKSAR